MKSKAFRYLWLGQAFANAGDVLYVVALIAEIYDESHSPLYMALVPFIVTFSRFLSSIIAPLLLDRYALKALLFHSQVLKTGLLLLLFFTMTVQIGAIWPLLVLAAMIAFLDGWAQPAQNAMVPLLVKREELLGTNGFLSTVDHLIGISGWSIGGILTAMISTKGTMAVTFILYIFSTIFMARISLASQQTPSAANKKLFLDYVHSLTTGWTEIWSNARLRRVHYIYWIETAASVVWIAAIMYIFVEKQLKVGEEWWGFINAAFFVGLILASIMMLRFHGILGKGQQSYIWLSSMLTAIITFAFSFNAIPVLALLLSCLFGLFDQSKTVVLQTIVQWEAEPDRLPKVYAAQTSLVTMTFGAASLAAGWFVEHHGVRSAFILSAICLSISIIPAKVLAKSLKSET
ncbi:MFS transporter [Falsibacillus albus]|uniref:MFS transporter n=1 Tax=Falsibacillus albus TaxID=2478915 RepID=A0A3L7K2N9_9BACI|nr:MFS transporter [Falsibacillus albus]RLQ97367.1 MFS transporter [Falsibacillus albus]